MGIVTRVDSIIAMDFSCEHAICTHVACSKLQCEISNISKHHKHADFLYATFWNKNISRRGLIVDKTKKLLNSMLEH